MKIVFPKPGQTVYTLKDLNLAPLIGAKVFFNTNEVLWGINYTVSLHARPGYVFGCTKYQHERGWAGRNITRLNIKDSKARAFKFKFIKHLRYAANIPTFIPAGTPISILNLGKNSELDYVKIKVKLPKPFILIEGKKYNITHLVITMDLAILKDLEYQMSKPSLKKRKRIRRTNMNRFTRLGL